MSHRGIILRCIPHSLLESLPWGWALGVHSSKVRINPLSVGFFLFLSHFCIRSQCFWGQFSTPTLRCPLKHGSKRVGLTELMPPFQDHLPGVRNPEFPIQMLQGPVQVPLSIGSDFLRADCTIMHNSSLEIWNELGHTDWLSIHTYTRSWREAIGWEEKRGRLWARDLQLHSWLDFSNHRHRHEWKEHWLRVTGCEFYSGCHKLNAVNYYWQVI